MARRGARAVISNCSRSQKEAEATAKAVECEGAEAIVIRGDVAIDAACARTAIKDAAASEYGGAYRMIRASRRMLEAGTDPGAVVNIGSVAGLFGQGSSVPYAASKAALKTLILSLTRALAPKIIVNDIFSDYIDTRWYAGDPSRQQALREKAARVAGLRVACTA